MSRDLRRYAKQTNIRLVIGFILILLVVGDGLIYLFYGRGAAIMGIICIFGGLTLIILILLVLWFIDWIVRTKNPD